VANGSDDDHDLDLSEGTLLLTNGAIVFFTSRKKWRIPWRSIVQARTRRGRTLHVETNRGRSFSFEISTTSDAMAIGAAAIAMMETEDD
jgi:hypothetical protein